MMQWENTSMGYGVVARVFHIVIAIMVIGQWSVGGWMVGLPDNLKANTYGNHKTFGLILLILVSMRLCWRLINKLPDLPTLTPHWQVLAARSLHRFFYVLLIVIPITGWMMSTAAGYLPALPWVGKVAFPFFQAENFCVAGVCYIREDVGAITHDLHEIIAWFLAFLVVIHSGIALWHAHLKDGVFERIFIDKTG